MKQHILFAFLLFAGISVMAQPKSPTASLKPYIDKVIATFPTQFFELRGEAITGEPGTSVFESTLRIPGATENRVVGVIGKKKNYWSWESKLLVTEDFEVLKRTYKTYFNDISGNSLLKGGSRRFVATAPYEMPNESQRLWSNQFRLNEVQAQGSTVLIDLLAENVGFEWIIWLRVYEKERDADMRPSNPADDDGR